MVFNGKFIQEEGDESLLIDHTIYTGVKEEHITLFETYWATYNHTLPPLPSLLLNETNQQAAVLNVWLGMSSLLSYRLLKSHKTFSHSFVFQLIQTFHNTLPEEHFMSRPSTSNEVHFLFSYYFAHEVLQLLELLLQDHPHYLHVVPDRYFALSDDDLLPTDAFYKLIKLYNVILFNASSSAQLKRNVLLRATKALQQTFDMEALLQHSPIEHH